jgi:exodeoxyribonuclease V gamma subunit
LAQPFTPEIHVVFIHMKELFIYTSNHLDRLSEKLAEIVSQPVKNPLTPEIIVVHSKGMEHWVSMALAHINGISANIRFNFPNEFLSLMFDLAGLDTGERILFEPDIMTFRIMGALPSCSDQASFEEIKGYLAQDAVGLKRYQLASKISDTFDQYLTFRPEMIFSWEKGIEDHWQADLWRHLAGGNENRHRAGLRRGLLDMLPVMSTDKNPFPQQVSVFGVSWLPPFHLEVLSALSHLIRVNLFILNPCREYWSDIVNEKEIKRIKGKTGDSGIGEDALYFEQGNPLLSAFGTMGKDFFSRIAELEGVETELFAGNKKDTILSLVQSDILNLQDRTGAGYRQTQGEAGVRENLPGELNIRIHSCHSPMRELEVLHDRLLAMFEKSPGLAPRDILVMAPDIDTYVPYIHAVFDAQTDPKLKIPFGISDRTMAADNPLFDGFMALLEIADSRFGIRQVLKLLEFPGVKEMFNIRESEMPLIEKWIGDTNIRWGIDATHRKELGLPEFYENTWQAGLDRLLLGYAMPGRKKSIFQGILPYDDIEGGDTQVLGKFLSYFQRLLDVRKDLKEQRSLDQWSALLKALLHNFFAPDTTAEMERRILMRALDRLETVFNISGFDQAVNPAVIRTFLQDCLAQESRRGGFISKGVTFCSMLPLRSIPSKVICLIGMNYDAFPRTRPLLSFDVMAANPKPGDRIKRNDDKYLFLQALISAGEQFYISYVGRNQHDNAQIPPSVVVSDLLDYLTKGFGLKETDIVVRHRLQAFSDGYFGNDENLFSYSGEDFNTCLAAGRRLAAGPVRRTFIDDDLPSPDIELKTVDLGGLSRFFSNPCRYFLQQRTGIYLDDELWAFNETEDFELHGLNQYKIEQDTLLSAGEGVGFVENHAVEKALGRLPHGPSGEAAFSNVYSDVEAFREKIRKYKDGPVSDNLPVLATIGDFTVTGHIDEVYESCAVRAIFAKIGSRHLIHSWIAHLVACLGEYGGGVEKTILVGKDATWLMKPPPDACHLLEKILALYWVGMKTALPFFPETSFAYAGQRLDKNAPEDKALQAARSKWIGNSPHFRGESEDPYYQLCFPLHRFESAVKTGDFQEISVEIYEPLLANCVNYKEI